MTCDTCKGFNEYLVSFSVSCEVLPYLIRVEDMSLFHQLPTTEGKHRRGIILLMHVALMVSGSGLMILLSLQLVLAKYCMTMLMCSSISNYNQSWIPVNSFSADPVGCLCDFHCIQEKQSFDQKQWRMHRNFVIISLKSLRQIQIYYAFFIFLFSCYYKGEIG